MKNIFIVVLLSFLTLFTKGNTFLNFHSSLGEVLDSGGVEISPKIVSQVSNFRIYAYLSTTVPSGGKIRVIFPKEITR